MKVEDKVVAAINRVKDGDKAVQDAVNAVQKANETLRKRRQEANENRLEFARVLRVTGKSRVIYQGHEYAVRRNGNELDMIVAPCDVLVCS